MDKSAKKIVHYEDPIFLIAVLGSLSEIAWAFAALLTRLRFLQRFRFVQNLKKREDLAKSASISTVNSQKDRVLFFCSSAGEFEQVLPIIDRLQEIQPVVCFFSPSGIEYARKKCEHPFFLFPSDRKKNVKAVLDLIKPACVVVNRWELWPNFLQISKKQARLILINFARTSATKSKESGLSNLIKSSLLSAFDNCFCVGENNFFYYLSLTNKLAIESSDTKFDRVLDRSEKLWTVSKENNPLVSSLRLTLKQSKVLVLGSSWSADHKVVFPVAQKKREWSLIVCPHDVSPKNITHTEKQLKEHGFTFIRHSQLDKAKGRRFDVILIDCIGILAEVYAAADAAWVGGASHYRVHNVLEPASYNLPLAFGPLYETSQEAVEMVNAGYALSTMKPSSLIDWLNTSKHGTRSFVERHSGGAKQITEFLQREIDLCKS